MADIAQLLSNAAETKADFNFGKLNDAYWAGLEQAYKQRTRDAFQDPGLYGPDGNIDPAKAAIQALKMGGLPGAKPAADIAEVGFQQQRYGNAPGAEALISGRVLSPPSISGTNTAPEKVQQDMTQGRQSSREPLQPPAASSAPPGGHTVMTYANASGIPNDQLGAVSDSIARQLGVNSTDKIDTNDPQVRNVLVPAIQMQLKKIKDMGIGQTYAPGQATPAPQVISPINPQVAQAPPQQPQAAPQAAQPQQTPLQPTPVQTVPIQPTDTSAQRRGPDQLADQTLGGLVPRGVTPEQYLSYLQAAATRPQLPEITKALHDKIAAIQTALQPTGEIKNYNLYRQQQQIRGEKIMPFDEWRQQDQEQQNQRAILTGSVLPKLDKSQEAATGLRDSIVALHQARTQLDMPGGIFSGSTAEIQKKLAKLATVVGVPDSGRITNTEAFGSAIGERVLGLVKGLGAGAGISNADRDYAAGMAGGNIKLDETSIRRILDIGEKSARVRIDQHNSLVDRTLGANEALKGQGPVYKVEAPGTYQKPAGAALPKLIPGETTVNGLTYKGGNPKDKNSWEQRS